MASVYKVKDRNGKPYGPWRFKYKNMHGEWVYGIGWKDKQKTKDHAAVLEADHRAVRKGEKDMPAHWDKKRNTPFSQVVEEYLTWGRSCGGKNGKPWDKQNASLKTTYLNWWVEQLKPATLKHIVLSDVEKKLRELDETTELGPKSIYMRFEALRSLVLWSIKRGFIGDNPLRGMARMDVKAKVPHRALTEEETHQLLEKAPPDRRLWYETALETGYRVNELRSLKVGDLDLTGPTLPLGAEHTKNRKDARQPITQELAAKLIKLAANRSPEEPLLRIPSSIAHKCIKEDFAKADIVLKTDEGKATWHSLRKVFVNNLVRSGADVKTVMELARHSAATMSLETYASAKPALLRNAIEKAKRHIEPVKEIESCCTDVAQALPEKQAAPAKFNAEADLSHSILVRATGVEPALSCENQPLKLARLPIPPRAHVLGGGIIAATSTLQINREKCC